MNYFAMNHMTNCTTGQISSKSSEHAEDKAKVTSHFLFVSFLDSQHSAQAKFQFRFHFVSAYSVRESVGYQDVQSFSGQIIRAYPALAKV